MRLEQHIYTSGEKEFITIASTQGINREDQLKLENNSLYILPGSLLYKNEHEKPNKYIYYPLNEERFVVGKAIYIGEDKMGRPGNYLFHNYVISKSDFKVFYLNPASLIKLIEDSGAFKNSIPGESLKNYEILESDIKKYSDTMPVMKKDLILVLLYYCFSCVLQNSPLLLSGTDKEYLDFLEWLYRILPIDLREKISFDTYYYGTSLGIKIIGIPDSSEFQQSVSYSLKLNLSTQQYSSNYSAKETIPLVEFITEMVVVGKSDEINTMHVLENDIKNGDYAGFKDLFDNLSLGIREMIYSENRKTILNYIINKRDMEVLYKTKDHLTVEDLNILSQDTQVIQKLIEIDDRIILELIMRWFYAATDRKSFYTLIIRFDCLLELFLKKIESDNDINMLLEVLQVIPQHYSDQIETKLLDKLFNMLQDIKGKKEISKKIALSLDNLPESLSDATKLKRIYLKYELIDDPLLLNEMLESDISVLTEDFQEIVLDTMLRGILRNNKSDKVQKQLNLLLGKSADKHSCLLEILKEIESTDNIYLLLDIFKVIPLHYSDRLEMILLEKTLLIISKNENIGKLANDFKQSVENFPETGSKAIKLLRKIIVYALMNDQLLLNEIVESDISVLAKNKQTQVFDLIVKKILNDSDPEEIPMKLIKLYRNTQDKRSFLQKIIDIIERDIPIKARKTIKEPFLNFVNNLPKKVTVNDVDSKLEALFESKPSFIEKIWRLIR